MGFLEELPISPKCCCCISNLRIATILVGTVSLTTLLFTYTERVIFLIRHATYQYSIENEQVYYFLVLWFLLLVYVMPKILLNILLIFGAVKKKATSVSIYLWCNIVYFCLEALTMIAATVAYFLTDFVSWKPVVTFLAYYIVQIYFWLCVNSLYAELKLENQFSLRQQMRGATLTNINFSTQTSSSSSRSNRQQSFPLRLLRAS